MNHLTNPMFADETKAREWLEAQVWPDGPVCPHCGVQEFTKLEGAAHRPGLYQCNACRQQFTVTVGTLFERSKIPLNKWLMATFLLVSSKKGMSAHQLHRMLGVSYKSTWFMMHRIREALREGTFPGGLGGDNKVVEVDETYVGGKAGNRKSRHVRPKEAVVALVERDGKVRSFHVPKVNARSLRQILTAQTSRKSYLMTDDSRVYPTVGREFRGHGTVNHSIEEYVRGGFWHTNTVENYFSILRRGLIGIYQHVGPQHLKRYVGEFDFRYNTRDVDDLARTIAAVKGIQGKRLTYRRTHTPQAGDDIPFPPPNF